MRELLFSIAVMKPTNVNQVKDEVIEYVDLHISVLIN